jgi:hypothetical protein
MACDKVRTGKEIEQTIEDLDAYKVRNQCMTYNGMFVRLEGGDPTLFRPVGIEKGGDGIYTYLFDQNEKLHTAKVANQFEMGSLHLTLAYESKEKKGDTVRFNLLSGTFMKPWMMYDLEEQCNEEVQKLAQELFTKAGMNATYTDEAFITGKNVPVTKEQLDSYVDAGFQVKLYKERRSCMMDPTMMNIRIEQWKGKPAYADALRKEEEQLAKTKDFTLYKKGGRKMTRRYCKRTPCRKMGFSQKASCRPWKNCYSTRRKRSG